MAPDNPARLRIPHRHAIAEDPACQKIMSGPIVQKPRLRPSFQNTRRFSGERIESAAPAVCNRPRKGTMFNCARRYRARSQRRWAAMCRSYRWHLRRAVADTRFHETTAVHHARERRGGDENSACR